MDFEFRRTGVKKPITGFGSLDHGEVFPRDHNAAPLVSFYGNGERYFGGVLAAFFDKVVITGPRTNLCRIMTKEGSDKGSGWHNYTLLYHWLWRRCRDKITSLFELGLGTNYPDIPMHMGVDGIPGASLRGWHRYFSQAQIVGADIDKRILFSKERIDTFHVDQLDERSIKALWQRCPPLDFDIMIDDGIHGFEANTRFFINSIFKLKLNGYYIIEDIEIDPDNLNRYHEFFAMSKASGVIVKLPNPVNNEDNCLGIFR